jgi:predicted P-loop ATPase/GTPase
LLLFVGLGLKAAHFTDVISEKAKTEYNVLKSIDSFEIAYAVDSNSTNYFTTVDQVALDKVVILSPSVKPIVIISLQVWRNLQSYRQCKKGEDDTKNVYYSTQLKAPPLI